MARSKIEMPKHGFKNYIFMCQAHVQEKAMKEIRDTEVFQSVHTPSVVVKIRTGKERKREVRESYLMPGYFFGRTKDWAPERFLADEFRYSVKMMTTLGWGHCKDVEIERVTGLRIDLPAAPITPKLVVGDKATLLGWAFKSMPKQEVIGLNEANELVLESPLFGGVPMRVDVGNSYLSKSRV